MQGLSLTIHIIWIHFYKIWLCCSKPIKTVLFNAEIFYLELPSIGVRLFGEIQIYSKSILSKAFQVFNLNNCSIFREARHFCVFNISEKKNNLFLSLCQIKFAVSDNLSYSLKILFQIEDVPPYKVSINLQTSGNQFFKDEVQ